MFVTQAHSFRKQARLAVTLSWIGGYTNILTVLACGQVTSHVSGTVSQLGRDVAEGRWGVGAYMVGLLGVFACGAALSGLLTEIGRRRRWASVYVLPMAVEAAILAVFALLLEWGPDGRGEGDSAFLWLTLLPALAMGLQNATITRISGGSVRTTHVTGVMTDLGIETAIWAMRRRDRAGKPPAQGAIATGPRLLLLACILLSFLGGAALGTLAFDGLDGWAMVPAVSFLGLLVALDSRKPIGATKTNKEFGGDLQDALPRGISVFHISTPAVRPGRARLPNLTVWADGLEDEARVLLLDVTHVPSLDADALVELRLLAQRLSAEGRLLVLAGVTPGRYVQLRDAGVLAALDGSNVYPDLELAAAHAMVLLEEREAAQNAANGTPAV